MSTIFNSDTSLEKSRPQGKLNLGVGFQWNCVHSGTRSTPTCHGFGRLLFNSSMSLAARSFLSRPYLKPFSAALTHLAMSSQRSSWLEVSPSDIRSEASRDGMIAPSSLNRSWEIKWASRTRTVARQYYSSQTLQRLAVIFRVQ